MVMKFLHSSLLFFLFVIASLFLWEYENDDLDARLSSPSMDSESSQGSALFFQLLSTSDPIMQDALLHRISKNWKESYEILTLESYYFTNSTKVRTKLFELFKEKTKQSSNTTLDSWFQYVWNKKPAYSDDYFEFKANLHKSIDGRFEKYFKGRSHQSLIRLDEVRWGGVLQDGIPPLRQPKMIDWDEATYLKDSNIIFGIEVNGEARAYPKRILAWHEMFVDTVGGIPVAGVYCTLCGTVILYKTEYKGINHDLGTSGFLYRSNKLMYDRATQSLWSTLEGKPVIGPLVNKGIELDFMSVVTTTWGHWKELHPHTKVLSLETGHRRDYGEGIAYKAYFSSDDLMFTVPKIDTSLKNKDEILALRLPKQSDENLAISSKFLKKNIIFQSDLDGMPFVVFTDKTGAHRAYFSKGIKFKSYDKRLNVEDEHGQQWTLSEERMVSAKGRVLERFPSHNAFWFGYKAAFPNVKLIN